MVGRRGVARIVHAGSFLSEIKKYEVETSSNIIAYMVLLSMWLLWQVFAGPFFGAERAVVGAVRILIAGNLAVGTEGISVKPVTVAVKAILGKIFVPVDMVGGAKLFGLLPGGRLDA